MQPVAFAMATERVFDPGSWKSNLVVLAEDSSVRSLLTNSQRPALEDYALVVITKDERKDTGQ